MLDWPFRSAKQLASLIRRKKLGCIELLEIYLQRLDEFNPELNAIVTTDIDSARQRARLADEALAKGERWGPLHGVPMTIKEAFNVKGMPTSWGFPEYKDNYPATNAVAVERLLAAGAIIFGKTNVPMALADWQTFNEVYGTTNNPWNLERVPGGSSGGSAAALAAGLTALEVGSDIGASIRNPAHYCGVYGHKPSYGIATMQGHELPHIVNIDDLDIAAIGPMARSASDLALALDIIAGPDELAGRAWQLRLPKADKKLLTDYKVAIIYNDAEAEVDQSVQSKLYELTEFLTRQGVTVDADARPAIDSQAAHRTYIQLLRAATSSGLSDEAFQQNLVDLAKLVPRQEDYSAQMIRAQTMYHRDWLAINDVRQRMRKLWAEFFTEFDLLLCPTATTTAFAHNQQGERWQRMLTVNDKPQPTTTPLFWAGYAGHVYLPATVAPIGLSPAGLPVGVQIIGPQYADHRCIHFARLLEQNYYSFTPPPAFDD